VGTPRSLQGRVAALGQVLDTLWTFICDAMTTNAAPSRDSTKSSRPVDGFVVVELFL
jgi:hypothetical protein